MKRKVLIIEDEPVISEMMCILLETEGYIVISLSDTAIARQQLLMHDVAMVMLDVNLNGEDGPSMCTYIKQEANLKHIPVVLVSTNSELETIKNTCGADDFIQKPFDLDYFINKVNGYGRAVA
ncbi:response regulator transcription factor [Mucilaginibacter gynuensis]